MNKNILSLVGASLFLFSACQNEEVFDNTQTEANGKTISVTLNATRGEDTTTRTTMSKNDEYGSLESKWNAGDKIYVYNVSGEYKGYLEAGENITNQKSSTTAEYATSYATFTGTISGLADTDLANDFKFVYAGTDVTTNSSVINPEYGKFTINLGTTENVSDLSKWDIAYQSGKLIKTGEDTYSASLSFTNKMAFGYFTTEGLNLQSDLTSDYASQVTFDVIKGTVTAVAGTNNLTLPANKKFYMPLIAGASVNMKSDVKWTQQNNYWGYSSFNQKYSFTASAGKYHRLGSSANYGPVPFVSGEWTQYQTSLQDKEFTVASGTTVHFTQGNLRYVGSASTPYWKIDNQLEIQFQGSTSGTYAIDGDYIAASQDVTMFGWGESTPGQFHYNNTDNSIYTGGQNPAAAGSMVEANDWGYKFNHGTTLYMKEDTEYKSDVTTYRTLTSGEWTYLLNTRGTSEQARYAACSVTLVDGTTLNGLVVFPDGVTKTAAELLGFTKVNNASSSVFSFTDQNVSYTIINDNGLLFLPAAGSRTGSSVSNVGTYGRYWSSNANSATNACGLHFSERSFYPAVNYYRYTGFAVRLVY